MSSWKEYKLSEVYDFASGLSKSRDQFGFGYGFLSYMDIFDNYFVPNELSSLVNANEKERRTCSIRRGDVFLTRTSETDEDLGISSVALKDYSDATFNGFTKRLRPKNGAGLLPEYAGFYFRSPRFRAMVSGMSSMTTRASLNNEMLSSLSILVPPVEAQASIANILFSLHRKIDLLHRQNETLEALAETLFRQWFIMEADEYWEKGNLGDVLELVYGKALKDEIRTGEGFPVIGSSGVVGYHSDFLVKGPGIVIGRKGTLGKVIYLLESFFPIDTTYFVKSKVNSVGLFYEYFLLKTMHFEDMNSDSAVPGLNRDIALSTEIKIAPFKKIQEYNVQCSTLFGKLKQNNGQIHTLTQLRDSLSPKLMSGEVRMNQ